MVNILVAEDDLRILRLITDFLKKEGFNVYSAKDGQEALEYFEKENISLIILDVMMPKYNGWQVCKMVREKSTLPVMILTAKDRDIDELMGFDIGADEYMTKPFNPKLLIARVNNLLKRVKIEEEKKKFIYKNITLEEDNHKINVRGNEVELTHKEYELLYIFMRNVERIFSRENLIDLIWGYDYDGDLRTVDTHITRLRKKLGEDASLIKNIRGFGYRFGE
ncbi:response regulator transcription factor [Clostridium sp. B9]|uniref:response regulator transcription factor n=1 Tax=Clostridium sp. B9 TaxID=3423224 RepID=UPI003D2F12B9